MSDRDQGSGIGDQADMRAKSEMTAFEREVAQAFQARRVDAPAGFADRVQARAASQAGSAARVRSARRKLFAVPLLEWRVWATGAIAAVIVLGVVQGDRMHQQQERQAQAQREFETAQRITDQALAQARVQVERAGISLQQ